MIAICPRCGYPMEETNTRIVLDRDVKCSICSWSGSSTELALADESKFRDPRVFHELYEFLARRVSPAVGLELLRLGLVEKAVTKAELERFTRILINYTKAGFGSVLHDLIGETDGGRPS